MSLENSNVEKLQALAGKRFEKVGSGNLDAAMSVLIDEPIFELYPVGLKLVGQADTRKYYDHFFNTAGPRISSKLVDMFYSNSAVSLELILTYAHPDREPEDFRLLAIQPVEGDRFTGERLYGDTKLFELMFGGPIWSLLTPIES